MKPMRSCVVIFAIMLLLVQNMALADRPSTAEVRATIEPKQIRLGEHARLSLEWTVPPDGKMLAHDIREILGDELEVLRSEPLDTLVLSEDSLSLREVHVITSWDDGYYPIRPVNYKHVLGQDTLALESPALLLEVMDEEVELEEGIRDIRPIIPVSRSPWEIMRWILVGAAVVMVAYLIYHWLRKRKADDETASDSEKRESVPPHIAAISSLETLRRKQLWRDGKIKQHHIELTDILRKYVSKRFSIAAQEMTTREILHALRSLPGNETYIGLLSDILQESDMVKFAKYTPEMDRHEDAIERALAFVSKTLPETDHYEDNA